MGVQSAEPGPLSVPSGQGRHAVPSLLLKNPGLHAAHAVADVDDATVPGAQGWHEVTTTVPAIKLVTGCTG